MSKRYPVGKEIGGKLYFHLDYLYTLPKEDQEIIKEEYSKVANALPELSESVHGLGNITDYKEL